MDTDSTQSGVATAPDNIARQDSDIDQPEGPQILVSHLVSPGHMYVQEMSAQERLNR